MKIVILSTLSKHHTYFINTISKFFNSTYVIFTKVKLKKKYKTGPFYINEEEKYEEKFFKQKKGVKNEISKKRIIFNNVNNINSNIVKKKIEKLNPDIGIVFGTQLIKKNIYNSAKWGFINIHRGLTQYYRGLDSDLWPLLEKKFSKIGVTIHYLDENYDTGGIIVQKSIRLKKKDKIYHLRYITTRLATNLVLKVLKKFKKRNGRINSMALIKKGKYKSSMSLDLKKKSEINLKFYQKKFK